jgi:hypothetical protein
VEVKLPIDQRTISPRRATSTWHVKRPFILGLNPTINESPFLSTEVLYDLVGQNTGNLVFHYAIDRQLGGALAAIGWGSTVDRINLAGDVAVLPCANQLGPHSNYGAFAKKLASVKVPVVAIGLGAQASLDGRLPEVPKGTLDWIRAIADHAPGPGPNITVRGPFTMEVLNRYNLADRAVVMGCPSLFINPDRELGTAIAARIKTPERVAVASGNHYVKDLAAIEASLAQMVTVTSGSYVGQAPLEMLKLTRGEAMALNQDVLSACRDYICPHMDLEEFIQWTKTHGEVFFNVPSWMEHYNRFDLVVGTRIHGIMLALQAGIPALCIAHDSRTLELCKTMCVPYVLAKDVLKGLSLEHAIKALNFDPAQFDENRSELAKGYAQFLGINGLTASEWLIKMAS